MTKVLKLLNIMKGALSTFILIPLAYGLLVMVVFIVLMAIVLTGLIELLPRAKQQDYCLGSADKLKVALQDWLEYR